MYKRKYPKIMIDAKIGVLIDSYGRIIDAVILHQEIKGRRLRKSKTSGLQEAIDIMAHYPYSTAVVLPPTNKIEKRRDD